MKDLVLQNLELVRKAQNEPSTLPPSKMPKELPPEEPADSPKKAPVQDPYGTDDPDTLDVRAASVTDCTGLIPALPETDAELEHYQDLYHYLPDSPNQAADDSDHHKS